jgi:hypothetical protein
VSVSGPFTTTTPIVSLKIEIQEKVIIIRQHKMLLNSKERESESEKKKQCPMPSRVRNDFLLIHFIVSCAKSPINLHMYSQHTDWCNHVQEIAFNETLTSTTYYNMYVHSNCVRKFANALDIALKEIFQHSQADSRGAYDVLNINWCKERENEWRRHWIRRAIINNYCYIYNILILTDWSEKILWAGVDVFLIISFQCSSWQRQLFIDSLRFFFLSSRYSLILVFCTLFFVKMII